MGFTAPSTGQSWVDKISWPFLTAVIGSGAVLATSLGVDLTATQLAEINVFVAAVASLIARQRVTPWKPDAFVDSDPGKLAELAEVWPDPEGTEDEDV